MRHASKVGIGVLILLLLLVQVSNVAADVGVRPGQWAKYTGSFAGYDYQSIQVSISSVSGTTVGGTVTYQFTYANPQTESFEGDVLSGDIATYVIQANLNVGDTIYYSDYRSPNVEGVTTRTYAGASRNVVYATIQLYTYYWDQQTGILVEQTWGTGAVTSSYKLTETNIWGGGVFDLSSPLFPLLIIIVIVALVLLAVSILFLRRKKPAPQGTAATPLSTTQPSPPEDKEEKKKYCTKCGGKMPLDAVYCPKCAHKQPQE